MLELEETPFDLNSLIDDLFGSMSLRARQKGLEFKALLSPDVPSLLIGDQWRLKQILTNLTDNALKFTDKGAISIKIENQGNFGDKARILFTIKDTGIGIAKKDYDLVFKEFKRVDSDFVNHTQGTGLGLSLTKRIVELHGGEINFTSIEGKGTTFRFTIPK